MNKRQSVGPKLRFEVMKRDHFTCIYCGRTTPSVVLVIDHLVPVAEGGENEIDNLVTSCWECNSGKGATPLLDSVPATDHEQKALLLLERERQIKEYNEVKRQVRARENGEIAELQTYWDTLTGQSQYGPNDSNFRVWLRAVNCEDIKDYMDRAFMGKTPYVATRYFCGIMWRIYRERTEGDNSRL